MRLIKGFRVVCVVLLIAMGSLRAQVHKVIPGEASSLNVGVVSDENTRELEDMLLVQLQRNPKLVFMERTQLPKRIQELSIQEFLSKTRWDSCDVLILLNAFASESGRKERQLVVRLISTHTLQTLGLWVYPLQGADTPALALVLGSRMSPLLARPDAGAARKTISVSLLRADTPSLQAMAESATYLLAAQLQNNPGLNLVERWDTRDPAFEQWLRQTEPANVKPPDFFVEGSLTEVNSRPGLRLNINGASKSFDASTGAPSLETATAAAAAEIARDAGAATAAKSSAPEFTRFEKDARWFWKWGSLRQAAASADTAVYLGCTSRDTLYIRALASIHSRRGWAYVSNLEYADTPSAADLRNMIYGLERFLEITPPAAPASWADRRLYLGYSEDALQWAGALLQGLYFSELDLPGTEAERRLLRKLTHTLATRVIAYSAANTKSDRLYPSPLEHIDNIGIRKLPVLLTNYGSFMVDDPRELIPLYIAGFESAANLSADGLGAWSMFRLRTSTSHYPWVADWDNHAPDERFFEELTTTLTGHRNPEVRILAYLMPIGYSPPKPPARVASARLAWMSWAIQRLSQEDGFLIKNPTKYSFEILGCVGQTIQKARELLGGLFPEAAWRACITTWIAKAPVNSREEYAGHTQRYLQYLMKNSLQYPATGGTPQTMPTNAELASIYQPFMLAPPPLLAAARQARSAALSQLIEKQALHQPAPRAPRVPSVETILSASPVPRRSWGGGMPATAPARLYPEQVFSGGAWAKAICTARGGDGAVWVMFWDNSNKLLTFAKVDPAFQTVVSMVKVHDFDSYYFNCARAKMIVAGGVIYCVGDEKLYVITPGEATLRSLPLTRMGDPRIWLAGGRIWVTGGQTWGGDAPGMIYEYLRADSRLRLISSSMRSPALNKLDDCHPYAVSAMFDHEGNVYALINDMALYRRDDASDNWVQVYRTASHTRPNRVYPTELLWKAVGDGIDIVSSENIVDVLMLDPGFHGRLRGTYASHPAIVRTPDGTAVYSSDIKTAATTGTALWVVFRSAASGCNIGGWNKSTGQAFSYPLSLPDSAPPAGLTTLRDGFLLNTFDGRLFHLPRAKITTAR